ncbi:TIGR03986 family type III CRISPR-associated RAMP protein [Pseudoalteromonas viridis]|uniref:TIGR03986 family CRISPR-associated RAMP protein n=1 Tax=Pseudoalteromonas viridis TaxID=339617 RepID=A0ABX7VBX6_9GAMM|nr:TIGR03986 family CRISPR-associated RAMP protein [Pseudoalteromonas viridis]QTL37336.1 TIGR03986 family CRISPR-associated RAMP protein [Pseudoalteromonas viridis]
MTNKTFHNPYNFIPFSKLCDTQAIESSKASLQKHRIGHERFSGLSGRINCQITVQHPVVNGNQPLPPQSLEGLDDDQKEFIKNCQIKLLAPYLRDGKHAIPAASIRGMLSNLGEIITVSPPRVLEDASMYYRNGKVWKNQAYGVIYKKAQQWYLKPLGIPSLMLLGKKGVYKIPKALRNAFVYDDEHQQHGQLMPLDEIIATRCPAYSFPKPLEYAASRADIDEAGQLNWRHTMALTEAQVSHGKEQRLCQWELPFEIKEGTPLPKHPWVERLKLKPRSKNKQYNYRIIRKGIIGKGDKSAIYTICKDHDRVQNGYAFYLDNLQAKPIEISQLLVDRFCALLNSTDKARKERKGKDNKEVYDENRVNGRIVVFNCDEHGQPVHLCDSQMWRKRVGATDEADSEHSVYDFLPSSAGQPSSAKYKSHADEFQPFNGERKLSVMEQLFGTVADDKIDVQSKQKVTAFASRVRVYDAIASQPYQADVNNYYLLRLATGPKLPAPTMYFKPRGAEQGSVTKSALNRHEHEAKGYKVYLRHKTPPELQAYHLPSVVSSVMGFQGDKRKEELAKRKECTAAPIIEKGQTLEFELEFDNLKPQELALLLTLLEPKTTRTAQDPFIHQLGQAKPYGFGAVTLKVQQLTLEDKVARYASFEPEVTTRWHPEHGNVHDWVQRAYPTQVQLWRPERLSWLLALAEPLDDVQYPQCSDGDFSFEWFVANDRSRSEEGPQFLRTDSDNRSEPLVELEKPKGKGGNNNKPRHNINQAGHNKPRNKRKPHWKDNRR